MRMRGQDGGPGLWRALRWLGRWVLALLVLFEEWGWEPLARAMAWLGRWPLLRQAEALVLRLPPWPSLAVLGLPALALLPVKLAALWFVARGQVLAGLAVIVAAKLLGTALLARLFHLTQPRLMTLPWFARAYGRWSAFKQRVLAEVRASAPYRLARQARRRLRAWWRRGQRPAGP